MIRGLQQCWVVLSIVIFLVVGIFFPVPVTASSQDPSYYLQFNGNTDGSGTYIEVPNNQILQLENNFTIEAWARWDGSLGYRTFFSKPSVDDSNVGTGYAMVIDDGKPAIGLIGSQQNLLVVAPDQITPNEWTHVAGTFDGHTLKIFVNGYQKDEFTTNAFIDVNQGETSLLIGREFISDLWDRSFGGALHDVRLWNTVLSQDNILSYMDKSDLSGHPKAANLVGNWLFKDGAGITAKDSSGHHLVGALQNSPIWILKKPTVTSVSCSAASSFFGDSVTLTAAVTGELITTGSVNFLDGTSVLGTTMLQPNGQASYSTSGLSIGSHLISVIYSGDTNNESSTSVTYTQTVTKNGVGRYDISDAVRLVQDKVDMNNDGVFNADDVRELLKQIEPLITFHSAINP